MTSERSYTKTTEGERKARRMNTRNLLRWSSVILVGVYLVPLVIYYCKFADGRWGFSNRQDVWGQFGDFIGGMVNPVFSLAGTLGLLYTILLTREEVAYAQKQWVLARKEAKAAEELRKSAQKDEEQRLRRETTFMMYKIWISGDMQQIRTDVWAATREEVRKNSARPVSIEYWRGDTNLERHYYSWGTISHFVGDLSRLLQSGSLDTSLFRGAIPNCVYKNRELCWGIRGLISAFSFAGHLLGVPVPCAELMTAFV
jgi:hypothetical protein